MNINIKWNGKILEDIEILQSTSIEIIKNQIFSITNLLPANQLLIYNGKTLKDEEVLDPLVMKEGSCIMLIGTNKVINEVRKPQEVPIEKVAEKVPNGLQNIGNTCYINTVLQLLYSIRPIREGIQSLPPNLSTPNIIISIQALFKDMKRGSIHNMVNSIMKEFPMFNRINNQSLKYEQQDAAELWELLVPHLSSINIKDTKINFLDEYLSGIVNNKDGLPSSITILSCPINTETCTLEDCIRNSIELEGDKTFSKLPEYLPIKLLRFYWKKEERISAKILKNIPIPKILNMDAFCDEETKSYSKYELIGVGTHQGRTTDSGHYIAWARDDDSNNKWWELNDSNVTMYNSLDTSKISGGSNGQTAYLLIYKKMD